MLYLNPTFGLADHNFETLQYHNLFQYKIPELYFYMISAKFCKQYILYKQTS